MDRNRLVTVRYALGELVLHEPSGQRGAVVDVDGHCRADEQWYQDMAAGRPSREQPWYTVLVDGASVAMYVPEDQLDPDTSAEPVEHPVVDQVFAGFSDGRYAVRLAH